MEEKIALLDTSILIDFFRKTDKRKSKFYELSDLYESFCISVITEYEIFTGVNSDIQKSYWKEFLSRINIIPLDSETIQTAVAVNEELKKLRKQIDTADLFIAATALINDLPLATLNQKHFNRVNALRLIERS